MSEETVRVSATELLKRIWDGHNRVVADRDALLTRNELLEQERDRLRVAGLAVVAAIAGYQDSGAPATLDFHEAMSDLGAVLAEEPTP